MTVDEFSLVRERYSERCFTKSTNPQVLDVYAYILEHEIWDSDWWGEDYGSMDIIQIFEHAYSEGDWADLSADLPNWSMHQLELFTGAIMNGYLGYGYHNDTNSIYRTDAQEFKKATATIAKRFELLLPILNMEIGFGNRQRDLAWIVIDNFDFVLDHFDILLDADPDNLKKMQLIVGMIQNESMEWRQHLSERIQNALTQRQQRDTRQ